MARIRGAGASGQDEEAAQGQHVKKFLHFALRFLLLLLLLLSLPLGLCLLL